MSYSFEPKTRYKEYSYYRYSILKEMMYEEKIFCKNDNAFLQFLDDMNSKEIYSKFFSRLDRDMHKEGRNIVMRRNMHVKVDDMEDV